MSDKSTYLTDFWADRDALNFGDFQPALKEILLAAQTPLTVGVFGTWGSGKTSLMRMLRAEIEADNLPSRRTVWFTAWKYDRHDALWRALILRVLHALYPRETEPQEQPREARPILQNPTDKRQQKLIKLLERLESSVYQVVDWREQGEWQIDWWQFLAGAGEAGVDVAATLSSAGLWPQLKSLLASSDGAADNIKKALDAIGRETKAYRRNQLLHMEQFETTFREAIKLLDENSTDGRLIVFVDDLDRCLPEKAIEVLEAIKLFLEVPGTVFVLGMDREVVQRGIEARYGHFLQHAGLTRGELPISGDSYLQKIVQIPFHLPALAVGDLETFIAELGAPVSEMTRRVLARGLYPNPRQVKRVLNIFRLLQTIAATRELAISAPLLAKTVLIQTQFPDLYQLWREYPTLVRTLEREYARLTRSEDELLLGRSAPRQKPPGEKETTGAEAEPDAQPAGVEATGGGDGLLAPYLRESRKYTLLRRLLTFPPPEEQPEEAVHFDGLTRAQLDAYIRLAGAVTTETAEVAAVQLGDDLLVEMLSGDPARVEEAVSRLNEQESESDGRLHETARQQLLAVIADAQQTVRTRASAGNALALVGDVRDDVVCDVPEMVRIPAGPFLMGSQKAKDDQAYDNELPQHSQPMAEAYAIGKYPVTVTQYRRFVEDGGYTQKWQACWTDAGWQWREKENVMQPQYWDEPQRTVPNYPVVGVSWYEAVAYCNWLKATTGRKFRLPDEAMWEKAARGTDGRIYPWGNEWDNDKLNANNNVGRTTAVGIFPAGKSPYDIYDASGNVWEWCSGLSPGVMPYPFKRQTYEEDLAAEGRRCLRGGAFYFDDQDSRAASRDSRQCSRQAPQYRVPGRRTSLGS